MRAPSLVSEWRRAVLVLMPFIVLSTAGQHKQGRVWPACLPGCLPAWLLPPPTVTGKQAGRQCSLRHQPLTNACPKHGGIGDRRGMTDYPPALVSC